jgi:hypothetical protein
MIEMAVVLLRAVLFDNQTRCSPASFPDILTELRRIGEEQRILTRKVPQTFWTKLLKLIKIKTDENFLNH